MRAWSRWASSATTSRACSTSWASRTSPRRSSGWCCSCTRRWSSCSRRSCCGKRDHARGVGGTAALLRRHRVRVRGTTWAWRANRGAVDRRRTGLRAAPSCMRCTSSARAALIARLGSMRFIFVGDARVHRVRVLQFVADARPRSALAVPPCDLRAVAGDGRVLDGAADLADRRGDPPHRRQYVVAGRLAGTGVHDRARAS